MVEGPKVVDGSAPMHHDNQSSFSSKKIDQELEKGIDCEGLAMSVSELANGDTVLPRRYHELDQPTSQHPVT